MGLDSGGERLVGAILAVEVAPCAMIDDITAIPAQLFPILSREFQRIPGESRPGSRRG